MAITEDASTPLVVVHTGTTAPVTAAFSPPAKSLLVALIAGGYGSAAMTATVTDSGGHVWTAVPSAVGTTSNRGVAQIYYTYLSTAPGSITVSGAFTGLSGGTFLAIRVLNGASPDQVSAGRAAAVQTASTTGTVSITTTVTGSQVYGISDDPDTAAALTLNGATSLVTTGPPSSDFNNTTDGVRCVGWKATSTTGTPGATTLGGAWAVSAASCTVAFEVLPVQPGVTEDPSTPAVKTQNGNAASTTAAFSPPANSLLVAFVAIGHGANQPTVTDSGSHTWSNRGNATELGGTNHCAVAVFVCPLTTAPGAITVTATFDPNIIGGTLLAVRVLTGADPDQFQFGSLNSLTSDTAVTAASITATPVLPGSRIYGVSVDPDNTSAFTPTGATTAVATLTDATDVNKIVFWRATALTPSSPVSTALGGTWATANSGANLWLEIYPPSGTASLAAAAALTAAGSTAVTYAGATALAAVAALAPVVVDTTFGAETLPATSSLATDGTRVQTVAATLTGAAAMATAGIRVTSTAATLSAASNLTAPAFFTSAGAATLAGLAALSPDGTRVQSGVVTLAATATLAAAGVPGSSVTLTALATLAGAVGAQTEAAFVALAGVATFGGPVFLFEPVSAVLAGTSAFTVTSLVSVGASMAAVAALSDGAFLALPVAATLAATSALTDLEWQTFTASAQLPGVASLLVTGPFQALGGFGSTILGGSNLTAAAYTFLPALTAPAGPAVFRTRAPTYRLYAANTRTGRIGWELPFTSVSWNNPINAAGTLRATLVIEDALDVLHTQGALDPRSIFREVLTGPYRFSLVLVYGDAPIFAGPYLPSSIPADKPTVDIGAAELISIFDKRILYGDGTVMNLDTGAPSSLGDPNTDLLLGPTSPGALAKAIIDKATQGHGRELPITCSNPPDTRGNEQRIYYGFDLTTAGQALSQLSTVQTSGLDAVLGVGPDFRLDPYLRTGVDGLYVSWELQIGAPYLGANIPPWTFDDSQAVISQDIDASRLASTYYVPGTGQDRAKLITIATDRSLIDDGFPALEVVDGSHTSELNPDRLNAYATAELARYRTPTNKWTVKTRVDTDPQLGSYRVGDPMLLDIRRHPVIDPGVYPRRITEVSGDASGWASLVSAEIAAP